jgi:hypothetical protein
MTAALRPYLLAAWIGIAVQIGGRILDARWHATHDEFEAASQQLEAHWLLWLGVLVTLVAAGLALARLTAEERPGFSLLFGFTAIYVAISVWHFIEHANHNDPTLPHVLLAIGAIGMLVGVVLATLRARRLHPART